MKIVQLLLGLLSFGFSAYAYWPYYKDVRARKAHPTISTWICWTLIDVALVAGMLAKHALAPQVVAYVCGCSLVLYACLKVRAPLGWWWLDTLCVSLVVAAILAWSFTGEADVGICIVATAFIVSTLPMLDNMYRTPEREPIKPWLISLTGAFFGVLAIPAITIADALTPAIFFALGLLVVTLIVRPHLNGKLMSQILMRD